jgi:hypothetical protein
MLHFHGRTNSLIFLVVVNQKGCIKQKRKKLLIFWFAMCGVKELIVKLSILQIAPQTLGEVTTCVF